MKLLLVEDERYLSRSIKEYLCLSNNEVDTAYDGKEALYYVKQYHYDVIIMDVMMPVMDGITSLKQMRRDGVSTPIILLTAKSELEDKVNGLEAGADDYLTKPFQIKELLARIKALSRRKDVIVNSTSIGNVELDSINYSIKCGKKVEHLTPKEFQLVEYLIKNKDKYMKSERIFEDVWSSDTESFITVVFVFISTIRKKLAKIGANVTIESMRGEGYRIVENV